MAQSRDGAAMTHGPQTDSNETASAMNFEHDADDRNETPSSNGAFAHREFLFLRHGQTDWNLRGLLQGRSDRPLDDTGLAQARAAAECLAREDVGLIVSSPLLRAWQTAEIVSEKLDVPLRVDELLIERNFGGLEGRPVAEIMPGVSTGLEIASRTDLPPDTEPWEEVCDRALRAINSWLSGHTHERILFVSHYGVMCALCQQLCKAVIPVKNARPYHFVCSDAEWDMVEIGCDPEA